MARWFPAPYVQRSVEVARALGSDFTAIAPEVSYFAKSTCKPVGLFVLSLVSVLFFSFYYSKRSLEDVDLTTKYPLLKPTFTLTTCALARSSVSSCNLTEGARTDVVFADAQGVKAASACVARRSRQPLYAAGAIMRQRWI